MSINTSENYRYLFYVTLSYSFSILRPIATEIARRGGQVAWFIPEGREAENYIASNEKRLMDVKEVMSYNSDAVLAPGNYIPDFFPGIKAQVFHDFDNGKKHRFTVRGFFDLYCTQGPNITQAFNNLNDGTYEVVETGWSKLDALFTPHQDIEKYQAKRPVILYAPTFSPKLTSTNELFPFIKTLCQQKDWQWLVKLHPKATQEEIDMYKSLEGGQLRFIETADIIPLLQAADVILSDTSSIISEFAMQRKPVVALNNRRPESWMINFTEPEQLVEKIELALNVEQPLLDKLNLYGDSIHPTRDGKSSIRVVEAIESRIKSGMGHLKAKPLNLLRRLKIRKKLKYYRWS